MTIRYNEDLDPNEGPGFGCFIWQAILFAGILLLIPVGVFTFNWPVWLLATLMFIDLFLLFFVSHDRRLPAARLLRRSAWRPRTADRRRQAAAARHLDGGGGTRRGGGAWDAR